MEEISRLNSGKVQVSPWFIIWRTLKRIIKGLIAIIIAVFVIYAVVFVPTAIRFVPTDSFGMVLTKDPTIRMGVIPKNSIVLVDNNSKTNYSSIIGKFGAAFLPHKNVSKMRIIVGNSGRVLPFEPTAYDTKLRESVPKPKHMTYNGKIVDELKMPANYDTLKGQKWFLTHQYVAECVEGDCETGSQQVINEKAIMGEIKQNSTTRTPFTGRSVTVKTLNGDVETKGGLL